MSGRREIVRELLLEAQLEGRPVTERVTAARIELGPLQETGRHRHPCAVVGYVTAGTIRFQIEGGQERTLRAGDVFHEPANVPMAHFDNTSSTDSAAFVAFYLVPPGEERLIEMLSQPAAARTPPRA